jgi:hypothetical protein
MMGLCRNTVEWRRKLDVDNLPQHFMAEISADKLRYVKEKYPHGYHGVDREVRGLLCVIQVQCQ